MIDFDNLYREEYNRIYGKAWSMLLNVQDAEDATQESFIKAWRYIDTLNTDRFPNYHAWLFTIVTRVCIDKLRQRKVRYINIPLEDELEHLEVDTLEEVDAWTFVEPVLEKLSRQQREVIKLYFYAGHSRVDGAALSGDPKFANKIRAAHIAARKYRHLLEVS